MSTEASEMPPGIQKILTRFQTLSPDMVRQALVQGCVQGLAAGPRDLQLEHGAGERGRLEHLALVLRARAAAGGVLGAALAIALSLSSPRILAARLDMTFTRMISRPLKNFLKKPIIT